MAYEPLTPLPFLPIIGRFDLNTFIPGSSDYEIMARVVETYNKAVELFNQIISQYSDIDKTIEELTKEYQKQLDEYKANTDQHISAFEREVNTKTQAQDNKIAELAATVLKLQNDVDGLINGEYIDNYVKALATWIDNNLQQLVAKVVKYVWFEIDESGYFVAYIPDTWDFVNFGTELDPDKEDYGKLVLDWEPLVPDDPATLAIPEPPEPIDPDLKTLYITNKEIALKAWNDDYALGGNLFITPIVDINLNSITMNTALHVTDPSSYTEPMAIIIINDNVTGQDVHTEKRALTSTKADITFTPNKELLAGHRYCISCGIDAKYNGKPSSEQNIDIPPAIATAYSNGDIMINSDYVDVSVYAGVITYKTINDNTITINLPNADKAYTQWNGAFGTKCRLLITPTKDINLTGITVNTAMKNESDAVYEMVVNITNKTTGTTMYNTNTPLNYINKYINLVTPLQVTLKANTQYLIVISLIADDGTELEFQLPEDRTTTTTFKDILINQADYAGTITYETQ